MRWVVSGFVVALAIALVGCGSPQPSGDKQAGAPATAGSNVFRYSLVTNPTTLDPHRVQDGDTIDMLQQVFEGLVQWNEKNEVSPALAESWTIDSTGRVYTFKIRQGVKFHNGDPLSAEDIKWSFERACNPALKSPTAETYLSDIVGVRERVAGKADEVKGVRVVDPQTIEITIDKARPYFLGKLTFGTAFVVSPKAAKVDKEISTKEEMVGTGPFMLDSYAPDQLVRLASFKEYHGGAPLLDAVERPIIKDAATRLTKYRNGEIDLVQLERQDVAGLQEDAQFKDHLKFFDRASLWYVGINLKGYPPFEDRRVRQAIGMAIDKNRIVEEVLGGVNKVANSIIPPGIAGHRETGANVLAYDPSRAQKLLADAGFPGGKGMPELTMTFREARPDIRLVAEAVATDLKKNLNINVTLRQMEWRAYLEAHNRKEQRFFHMRWAADYLDAENFLSVLLATYGPENKVNYSNPEYDALTSKADGLMDQAERIKLYQQAEDIVLQDAPFVPIYFQRDAELINPRVQGLRKSIFGHLPHTTVTIR
jgi:ABC-type transport system substrate-binding protein